VPFPFPLWKHIALSLCQSRLLSWNCSFAIRGIPSSFADKPFFLSLSLSLSLSLRLPFSLFLFYGNRGLNQWDVFPQKRFVLIHYEGVGDSLPLLPSYWEVIAGLRYWKSMREWVSEWVWEGEIFKLRELIRSHIFRSHKTSTHLWLYMWVTGDSNGK